MNTIEDSIFKVFWSLIAAPNIGIREEKHLLRSVTFQARQSFFLSICCHVILIGSESFSETTVVGNIFALRLSSIDLFIKEWLELMAICTRPSNSFLYVMSISSFEFRHSEIAVLFDNALLPLVKFVQRLTGPPWSFMALFVALVSCNKLIIKLC